MKHDGLEVRTLSRRSAPPALTARGGSRVLAGYAAVFNRPSELLSDGEGRGRVRFREQIRPGAFTKILGSPDVRALLNHDANLLLGRTGAGTLRLSEDAIGLRYEIDLPDTQAGRDTAVLAERRDLTGSSFSFFATDTWDRSAEIPIRNVVNVTHLLDVGPVTYPAYSDTTAAMRSLSAWRLDPGRSRRVSRAEIESRIRAGQARLDLYAAIAHRGQIRAEAHRLADACYGPLAC